MNTRDKRQEPFLTVRLEGPRVGPGRIPLEDLIWLGHNMVRAVERVLRVLEGHADSRRKGRRPALTKQSLALDMVGLTPGSAAAVIHFERSEAQQHIEGTDPGGEVYEKWLAGMSVDFATRAVLPPGYDLGVLMATRDLGALLGKGIDSMVFSLNHRARPVRATLDGPTIQRMRQRVTSPVPEQRAIEGRLLMADFKEASQRIRIHPSVGEPVTCRFSEQLKEEVLENILRFVRVSGTAQADPVTGRLTDLVVHDVVPLDEPREIEAAAAVHEPVSDFWSPLELTEIVAAQAVRPLRALEDILGGWPEDELNDGFEEALTRWREPAAEGPRP